MNFLPKFLRRKSKAASTDYKLQLLFEKDGHKYYRFPKETNLPMERFSQSLALLEMLSCGLSGKEMERILSAMETAIAAGLSNPKNAGIVSTYVHIIRERQDNIIHRDLLLNIAATWIVRDDENPSIINKDIHDAKLATFEAMCGEASHDFFTLADIDPLMPLLTMSPQEFQQLWEYNTVQIQSLNKALTLLDSHRDSGRRKQKNV